MVEGQGTRPSLGAAAVAGLLALGLAACEGDDGSLGSGGPPGPTGPTGPTGPNPGAGFVQASQADVIFPTITGVAVGTQTVVSFRLGDSQNRGVIGLQALIAAFYSVEDVRMAREGIFPTTGARSKGISQFPWFKLDRKGK